MSRKFWERWTKREEPKPAPVETHKKSGKIRESALAALLAMSPRADVMPARYRYELKAPVLPKGVVPEGTREGTVLAFDANPLIQWAQNFPGIESLGGPSSGFIGFPGYPYLSFLSTRAEFRSIAETMSKQITREWIKLESTETAGDDTKAKVTELEKAIEESGLREVIAKMVEHDCYFGRSQMLIDIDGHDLSKPLVIDPKTIKKDSAIRFTAVEPIWVTPVNYNASDPSRPDFYKPDEYFMMGKQVHASRFAIVTMHEVPDILKPAFNFGGISVSQLAEPTIDNWLRTRTSIADLITKFSTTALKTTMGQVLTGDSDGADLLNRTKFFNAARDNFGTMLLDFTNEDLVQLNVPLSGLSELQSQAQEQQCTVAHIPATILLGVAPTGFGNVAEGEIRSFYDWIAALQTSPWSLPVDTAIKVIQVVKFGMIDPDITWSWEPLYQMTPKEEAEIRASDATADCAYIDHNVVDGQEVREKLARDAESGYQGLDLGKTIGDPDEGNEEVSTTNQGNEG